MEIGPRKFCNGVEIGPRKFCFKEINFVGGELLPENCIKLLAPKCFSSKASKLTHAMCRNMQSISYRVSNVN